MKRLHFDVEGDGFLDVVTRLHCIAAKDADTGETFDYGPDAIAEGMELLSKADVLIAHYGLGYDFPVLEKLHDFKLPIERKRDSYIIAKLMKSGQKDADTGLVKRGKLPGKLHGKHSIEAWGHRLGRPKLHADIEDWSKWTPEMHERCIGDVDTQDVLWKFLNPDAYSQEAIDLEHRVAMLTRMMEAAGCPFDEKAAQELHIALLGKQHTIGKGLIAEFGSWYEPTTKALDADGCARTWTPKRDNPRLGYIADAPMTKIEKVTFNPSSRRHIIKKLKELGWKPESFTNSGEAELSDVVLEGIADEYPQAGKLVEYLLLDKRLGQIADGDNAWLKKVGPDGKMHGAMDTMGTVHSRASHFSPNMGQVPASKSPYGRECRVLFGPNGCMIGGEPAVQVGADMSGLQLRGLAHYLHPFDGGAYSKIVTEGDVHWSHAQAMGLVADDEKRDKHSELHEILREKGAKTFGYAYIFGCFPKKSGAIVRDCTTTAKNKNAKYAFVYEKFFGDGQSDTAVGNLVRKKFDEKLNLDKLQQKLKTILRYQHPWKGHIPGIDGRWVPCRSDHSVLNFALSSAEAILCKTWIVMAYETLIAKGYKWGWDGDFVFMLWVHDEIQIACKESIAEEIGKTLVECAKQTGIKLGFRVPLASEYKVGRNWADTH